MTVKDAVRTSLEMDANLLGMLLADLSDADLLVRPVPGANHIAWQIGHCLTGEAAFQAGLGGPAHELPAGFAALYGKEGAAKDTGFLTRDEYLRLAKEVRATTLKVLDRLSDADLAKPSPPSFASYAPTYLSLLLLCGQHAMMHIGQFSVVRRKLGKPIVF